MLVDRVLPGEEFIDRERVAVTGFLRESRPPRTAATTSALRRMTQRFVPGVGKLAIVKGLPSGPMTYGVRGRRGSITNHLMHLIEQLAQRYAPPPKIFLRASDQLEIGRKNHAV